MTDSVDFSARLAVLREQYTQRLEETLSNLVCRVSDQGADITQRITLLELHASLHKLAGSGGTFGFTELSRRARLLEVTAKAWLDRENAPEAAEWETWKADLAALRESLVGTEENSSVVVSEPAAPAIYHSFSHREQVHVLLIEAEPSLGDEMSQGLSQFGYLVKHCTNFPEAERAIRNDAPDLLVVDSLLSGFADCTEDLPLLFERLGFSLPAIFLMEQMSFSNRLAAAKAGGRAFLTKPVDISLMAGSIEMLVRERDQAPYRVLIVDDDETLAEHYRLVLEASGMLAEKVCRPEETLAALQFLHPDLLLLDLYMPDCKGSDLAVAIRYEDAWLSLPIIFISAEDDLEQQIKALNNGGDDFITKPISDARLVATVRARAARARKIDELMSLDSLTGLLKHSSIKDRLAQEFDSADRQGAGMAMVMLDIDHFKQVNDSWGHPVGDQVLKTLAQLLRQRLRRQDSIGRYGGEEFAIVLPGCTAENALHLLNDIRQRFSEIYFKHKQHRFTVTLSAGIATKGQCSDAGGLLAAADAALYVAKDGGRNQVQLFESQDSSALCDV